MPATLVRRLKAMTPALSAGLVWMLSLAICAWVAASWYWRFKAPLPPAHAQSLTVDPNVVAGSIVARHFYGEVIQPAAAAPVAANLSLIGIASNLQDAHGFAIIKVNDQAAAPFIVGDEVVPGTTLIHILPTMVELRRGNQVDHLMLSDPMGTMAAQSNYIQVVVEPNQASQQPVPAAQSASAAPKPRKSAVSPDRSRAGGARNASGRPSFQAEPSADADAPASPNTPSSETAHQK